MKSWLAVFLVFIVIVFAYVALYKINEENYEWNWKFKFNIKIPKWCYVSVENSMHGKKLQKKEPGTAIPDSDTQK